MALIALSQVDLRSREKDNYERFSSLVKEDGESGFDFARRILTASRHLEIPPGADAEKKRFKRVRQKLSETAELTAEDKQQIRNQTDINDLASAAEEIFARW